MRSGIICTSGALVFQLLADDDCLIFVRLGSPDDYDEAKCLAAPSAYRPGANAARVAKKSVSSADCMYSPAGLTMVITWDGKSRRFFTEENVQPAALRRLFAGCRFTVKGTPPEPEKKHARKKPEAQAEEKAPLEKKPKPAPAAKPETREEEDGERMPADKAFSMGLMIAAVLLLILRAVCRMIPGLTALSRVFALGWIAIPLIWLPSQAKLGLKQLQSEFGAVAAFLSMLLLFMLPELKPDSWLGLIPVMLIAAAAAAAAWVIPRKQIDATLIAVLVASLLYAPGAALSLNDMTHTVLDSTPVTVEEISNAYSDGEWYYYVTVEQYGVVTEYQISRADYNAISSSGGAEVQRVRGLLGCVSTSVVPAESETVSVIEEPAEETPEPTASY